LRLGSTHVPPEVHRTREARWSASGHFSGHGHLHGLAGEPPTSHSCEADKAVWPNQKFLLVSAALMDVSQEMLPLLGALDILDMLKMLSRNGYVRD
jgi:hypothetical protein